MCHLLFWLSNPTLLILILTSSLQADVQLVDREQAEHVDAALQTMKESLQVLREPSQVIIITTQITISEFCSRS